MDWWTTRGNYATYRGKDNEGKKEKAFAEDLTKKMAEETTSQHHTAAQVQFSLKFLTQQQLNGVQPTNGLPKPLPCCWVEREEGLTGERSNQPLLTMPLKSYVLTIFFFLIF
jgi:hypothetical protein